MPILLVKNLTSAPPKSYLVPLTMVTSPVSLMYHLHFFCCHVALSPLKRISTQQTNVIGFRNTALGCRLGCAVSIFAHCGTFGELRGSPARPSANYERLNSLVAHAFHPPCSGELKCYLSTILSTSPTYTYGQESPVQTIDHHQSSLHRLEFDLLLADRRSHH